MCNGAPAESAHTQSGFFPQRAEARSKIAQAASTIFTHEIGARAHAESGEMHDSCLPERRLSMRFVILIILLLLVLGALPAWPYSSGWGYYPSGIGLIILIIVAVLLLRG
jgi:hypothetical protein